MLNNTFDNLVGDIAMCRVPPPKQDIRFGKAFGWQAVLWLLQNRGRCRNFRVGIQGVGDTAVHTLRVQIRDNFIGLFMDVFAPDDSTNGH
jgi:hypothetical protein